MISIAICEDDVKQQQVLEALLNEIGLKESLNLHKFNSGEDLIKSYESGNKYSIVLLDMQLNEMDGIQTAKIIKQFDKNCLFIIITSIMEYAVEGYSIDAYEFIMKPVNKDKFNTVIKNAIKELQSRMNKTYLVKTRERMATIRLSEIRYIESNKNGVIIHTNEQTYNDKDNISSVEKRLKQDGFIRISRYYIVNIYQVKEIGVSKIILVNGEELIYSNKYRDDINKEYLNFMMGDM